MTATQQLELAYLLGAANQMTKIAGRIDPSNAALAGILGPLGSGAYAELANDGGNFDTAGLRVGGRSLAEGALGATAVGLPLALADKKRLAYILAGMAGTAGSMHGAYRAAENHNADRPLLDRLLRR